MHVKERLPLNGGIGETERRGCGESKSKTSGKKSKDYDAWNKKLGQIE